MHKIVSTLIVSMIAAVACNSLGMDVPNQNSITATAPSRSSAASLTIGDGGIITGQPCAAPCFFGIRVSETPFEQAIPTLEAHNINSCAHDSDLTILCDSRILIGANPSTFIVDSIGYYPDNAIYIREIISKYGTPDSTHVVPSGIPEAPTTVMLLFFDKLGMRIRLPENDGGNYTIVSTTTVELVNYFDKTNYAEVKENQFSQPWKGYGTYQSN